MSLLPKQKCFDCDVNGRLESENRSLQVEIHKLQQNQDKLIEALDLFAEHIDHIKDGHALVSEVKIKIAANTLKEVCGEEKK